MINPEKLSREVLLFAYSSALERGDFARLGQVLEQAAQDPILERQILEIHAAQSSSPGEAAAAGQAAAPAGDLPGLLSAWRRLKTALAELPSDRLWSGPTLRLTAVVLAAGLVILVIYKGLLGPAVGNVFSNIVSNAPHDLYPTQAPVSQYDRLAGYPAPAAAPAQAPAAAPAQPASSGLNPYGAYPAPAASQPAPAERMIVRSGSLSLVVKDPRQARQAVLAMVAEVAAEGAFVVSASESYPNHDPLPVIQMTLRVPVSRYDESMTRLAGLALQVLHRQENAQDVTQAYVDVSARLEALQTSRERLLQIVREAKNTDDLLRAEQELSRREAELEAARANQKYLEQTAALSSITLELQPPVTSQPVTDSAWNPAVTSHNALRAFLASLRALADGLIYFAIATLPWLVLIALLVIVAVRLVRRRVHP